MHCVIGCSQRQPCTSETLRLSSASCRCFLAGTKRGKQRCATRNMGSCAKHPERPSPVSPWILLCAPKTVGVAAGRCKKTQSANTANPAPLPTSHWAQDEPRDNADCKERGRLCWQTTDTTQQVCTTAYRIWPSCRLLQTEQATIQCCSRRGKPHVSLFPTTYMQSHACSVFVAHTSSLTAHAQ